MNGLAARFNSEMKKKNIFILLAVFAVIVLIAVIIEVPLSKRGQKKAAKELTLFSGFDAEQATSIEIITSDRQVKLNRDSGAWLVATSENYPADPKAIETALAKVVALRASHIASKSAEKHPQFEVDKSGIEVKVLGAEDNLLAHFFVGKMGPDYMSSYVRKADQDTVFLVGEYLRSIFDKGARGWRDRTIFSFDVPQVKKLTLISKEKGEIVIEARDDGGWQIIKPEVAPANKEMINQVLSDVSKLSADDFAEKKDLKEYKLDDPQAKIIADMKDGSTNVLLVGDKSDYRQYVKRADKDTVFMLSKSRIDGIFKGLEELKAKPEEGGDA